MRRVSLLLSVAMLAAKFASASDQTVVGAGNAVAEQIASKSALVLTAKHKLVDNAQAIQNSFLRRTTLDAIANPTSCITHRIGIDNATKDALVQKLIDAKLVNPADGDSITGGIKAGIFPPILRESTLCPQLPLAFDAAPGSSFGGHHSYPGGLPIHEANNDVSFIHLADLYRGSYGSTGLGGLPIFTIFDTDPNSLSDRLRKTAVFIDQDIVLGAPLWHDWAKPIVFQWNADGTEFTELNFGGTGTNDAWGSTGDSRTGAHHILGIAETMRRGLAPDFVITQASAHSAPTSGNEYKVVNWLRAAAIIAQIDPVAYGYLTVDQDSNLRLPALRQLGNGLNLNANGQTNLLVEYALHNLSDADFNLSGPAVSTAQVLLQQIASNFGYDPADVTTYNTKYRNVVLSNTSGERLLMLYGNGGLQAVTLEVQKLRQKGII